jgi:serine O-acetyltransferase
MLFKNIRDDIDGMIARDPAARSRLEVVLTYPGFHAVVFYRAAHWLFVRRWRLLARMVSHFGRLITGIDIHPGATIGRRLFIDHGTGLVIGETAEIGDDVTLYQGVTLGGVAPSVDSAAQVDRKRHPTLRNKVIVGSGAQVLGPITVGEGARVGANAVAVADVPAGVTVVGIPAKVIVPRKANQEFRAYGMPTDDIADPITRAIDGLLDQVSRLKARVEQLEGEAAQHRGNGETDAVVEPPAVVNPEDRHTPDC